MIAELFWMDGNGPFVWGAWIFGGVLLKTCLAIALYRDRRLAREVESAAMEGRSPEPSSTT